MSRQYGRTGRLGPPQPTNEEEIDDVQDQETTGAAREDRPDEQGEDVVQQPEADDEDHAEGEEAQQEKLTQLSDQASGPQPTPVDLGEVWQSIWDRNRNTKEEQCPKNRPPPGRRRAGPPTPNWRRP